MVRQPSTRWGLIGTLRYSWRSVRSRSSGVSNAVLAIALRRLKRREPAGGVGIQRWDGRGFSVLVIALSI